MVIPAAAVAERRVADHFRKAGATSPAAAIAFEPTRMVRARALGRLKHASVVLPAAGGWYLDEQVWSERRNARRKRAAIVAGIAAIVAGVIAVF